MSGPKFFDRAGKPMSPQAWMQRYAVFDERIIVVTNIGDDRSICTLFNGIVDPATQIKLYAVYLAESGQLTEHLRGFDDEPAALEGHGYFVGQLGQRFFCPACWKASSAIEDLKYGWCGSCNYTTGQPWAQRNSPNG